MTAPRPTCLPKPKTTDPWMDRHFRAGWLLTEQHVGDQPREIREAVARDLHEQRKRLPVDSPGAHNISGALAYLAHRHEQDG